MDLLHRFKLKVICNASAERQRGLHFKDKVILSVEIGFIWLAMKAFRAFLPCCRAEVSYPKHEHSKKCPTISWTVWAEKWTISCCLGWNQSGADTVTHHGSRRKTLYCVKSLPNSQHWKLLLEWRSRKTHETNITASYSSFILILLTRIIFLVYLGNYYLYT